MTVHADISKQSKVNTQSVQTRVVCHRSMRYWRKSARFLIFCTFSREKPHWTRYACKVHVHGYSSYRYICIQTLGCSSSQSRLPHYLSTSESFSHGQKTMQTASVMPMLVTLHWYHIHSCPISDDSEPPSLWFKLWEEARLQMTTQPHRQAVSCQLHLQRLKPVLLSLASIILISI